MVAEKIPRCNGYSYHVFGLGAAKCSICGYDRYPEEVPMLTKCELAGLVTVEQALRSFDAAVTSRSFLRRNAERLEARGLIRFLGMVHQVDDHDNIRHNAAMRKGWVLTAAGYKALHDARERRGALGL